MFIVLLLSPFPITARAVPFSFVALLSPLGWALVKRSSFFLSPANTLLSALFPFFLKNLLGFLCFLLDPHGGLLTKR